MHVYGRVAIAVVVVVKALRMEYWRVEMTDNACVVDAESKSVYSYHVPVGHLRGLP